LRPTKDFEAKYNKVKVKLALLSSSALASKALMVRNKGLITEAYKWDEQKVSSDDNEMVEVKVLMTLAKDNDSVSKEGARNEQRNNLMSKHRDIAQELNTCKEQLLVLKQAKLDFLTMQHVNTKILKENRSLRKELKELTTITETWLYSSNKVNQCISEQIPTQKKRIMGVDQLTKDPSNSGQKSLVFVKSSAGDTKCPFQLLKDPVTDYDSTDESSVYNTSLPLLEKLAGAEPDSRPKTIKSILKSNFTFKAESLKGITINEPSLAPAKVNKIAPASKNNSAPASKLKNVKVEDDLPLATK
ncbi:hypothetical protein Tco_1422727, partial [Tanacetum coccineum]